MRTSYGTVIGIILLSYRGFHYAEAFGTHTRLKMRGSSLKDDRRRSPPELWSQPPETGAWSTAKKKRKYSKKAMKSRRNKNFKRNDKYVDFKKLPSRKLNQDVVASSSAQEVLDILAATKGALSSYGCGGKLNTINFSTIIHRLARYAIQFSKDGSSSRSKVLQDPRFALFVVGMGEVIFSDREIRGDEGKVIEFYGREIANILWALAKIKIAPPSSAMPREEPQRTAEKAVPLLKSVREAVYDAARARAQGLPSSPSWIPALSALSGYIMDALFDKVATEGGNMGFKLQEWSNIIWAAACVKRASPQLFSTTIANMVADANTIEVRPQEFSNAIWALATSGVSGPEEELLGCAATLLSNDEFRLSFKPQELANTVWGVATIVGNGCEVNEVSHKTLESALRISRAIAQEITIRLNKDEVVFNVNNFKTQELSNACWAFATLGFGLVNDSMEVHDPWKAAKTIVLPSDDHDGDQSLMTKAVASIFKEAKMTLKKFKSQEINNLVWASARLNQRDDDLIRMVSQELSNPRRRVDAIDLSLSLWSMAKLEFYERDPIERLVDRFVNLDDRVFDSQHVSNTCWAVGTAELVPKFRDFFDPWVLRSDAHPSVDVAKDDPLTAMFILGSSELRDHPDRFKPQELKDTLWSFSKSSVRHPKLIRFMAEYLLANNHRFEEFSSQSIGNLMWLYGRQCQLLCDTIRRCEPEDLRALTISSGRLAMYTASLIDVGEHTLYKLFQALVETYLKSDNRLKALAAADLSNSCWSLSVLGLKHDAFIDGVQNELIRRIKTKSPTGFMKSQEIASLLWSFSVLNIPHPELIPNVAVRIVQQCTNPNTRKITAASIARKYTRRELGTIAWSCAVMREYPPDLINVIYMGLFGCGDDVDKDGLTQLNGGESLESATIMIALYLQVAMDLDGATPPGLHLPEGFPSQWDTLATDNFYSWNDDDTENLAVHVSNMQKDASAALDRIGFKHKLEHTITMADLVKDFGISFSPEDKEVLSIDLACPETKVGIEMDGPAHFLTDIEGDIDARREGKRNVIDGKVEYEFVGGEHNTMNGSTALKHRILEQMGWRIVNVPYWDWTALGSDRKAQDAFFRDKLSGLL